MAFHIIESAAPKYLAACDILIGDMSNINYEFLLFNRPLILIRNDWVNKYFPDIGIKSEISNLDKAISRSIGNATEFEEQRKFWLEKTITLPDQGGSSKLLDILHQRFEGLQSTFVFIDGNNPVRRTNLLPLFEKLKDSVNSVNIVHSEKDLPEKIQSTVFIGAHCADLKSIPYGYKVHIDHDLKGIGTANIAHAFREYKKNNFYPAIDMHITAGLAGDLRTKYVLGPLSERTVVGSYPKADDLKNLNCEENKKSVFKELGFDISKPLIMYAPAGAKSYMKPGGSLSPMIIAELRRIAYQHDFQILVKTKARTEDILNKYIIRYFKKGFDRFRSSFCDNNGDHWLNIKKVVLANS